MHNAGIHNSIGVGLRHPHLNFFEHNPGHVSWLEVHSENYFEINSPARQQLRSIRQQHQISCHGVGLSLGSVGEIDKSHLQSLVDLIDEIEPSLVSDHLSWSQNGGVHFNDLLPLPYTEEALEVFVRNVLQVQDAIKRPLLIENPSSYLRFNHSTISEWDFLNEVQQRSGCQLLLDLNNIYVSSLNHGFDALHYLNAINRQAVQEIHLAGFTVKEIQNSKIWIDTHSTKVCDEVWELYRIWNQSNPNTATLIEWDMDIPSPEVLLGEAEKASVIAKQFADMREAS
ncbi:DUF692 domain-containing protein [Vibrio breoganii]|uniref:DUF692 domain-containing protein n=1 Tax=Vibrio breoganii TaxID=553239 RepID=A0ABX1UAK2_9VIBR|nr:DUF692 domain-containing protein [Vibrio breoganii]NMO74990.1 DUF692 domain-containing protein [Vibrio breoganii]NMR71529.1 DUF692 domain-containing protein [Vibrio breoganii]PML84353.1 hypothetical protein BCT67_16485 [Vibrio breoganii]